jgi:uncharacterized protein YodC (DUF2158 family)
MLCPMPTKPKTLDAGDLVKLKSGGPVMTVTGPGHRYSGPTYVHCTWFAGKTSKGDAFPIVVLVR